MSFEVKQVTENLFRGSRPRDKRDLDILWQLGVRRIISLEEGWGNLFRKYDDERKDWLAMTGVILVWTVLDLCLAMLPTRHTCTQTYSQHGSKK
jgi:hypothetical protein